ncbi:MAG: type II secretion system protein [Bacilli bacterium]|nr:type II secretion system protein [Bacilli bacterium]
MIKNKGFTLIELLATIVILGLLALIVTPGIVKVIRNSKLNTTKASMEGYIREVENAVALYMSDTGDIPDSIDDLELDGKNLNKVLNVTVVFDNDGTITKITATIDEFKCVYIENNTVTCQDKDIVPEIAFDESKCNTTLTSVEEVDVINNKLDTCVSGDGTITRKGNIGKTKGTYNVEYTVTDIYGTTNTLTKPFILQLDTTIGNYGDVVYYDPVNNVKSCNTYTESNSVSGVMEGCMKWHILSENEDGTINLILDHNIISEVMWYEEGDTTQVVASQMSYVMPISAVSRGDNSKGPITALNALYNAVKDKWNNALLRTDSFTHTFNNGEEDITYTVNYNGMKARLPKASEIAEAVGYEGFNDSTTTFEKRFYFDSKVNEQTVGYGKEKTVSDYAWLFNNLGYGLTDSSNTETCLYYGCEVDRGDTTVGDWYYWTSIALSGNSYSIWGGSFRGELFAPNCSMKSGVRPVITLNFNN